MCHFYSTKTLFCSSNDVRIFYAQSILNDNPVTNTEFGNMPKMLCHYRYHCNGSIILQELYSTYFSIMAVKENAFDAFSAWGAQSFLCDRSFSRQSSSKSLSVQIGMGILLLDSLGLGTVNRFCILLYWVWPDPNPNPRRALKLGLIFTKRGRQ